MTIKKVTIKHWCVFHFLLLFVARVAGADKGQIGIASRRQHAKQIIDKVMIMYLLCCDDIFINSGYNLQESINKMKIEKKQ